MIFDADHGKAADVCLWEQNKISFSGYTVLDQTFIPPNPYAYQRHKKGSES